MNSAPSVGWLVVGVSWVVVVVGLRVVGGLEGLLWVALGVGGALGVVGTGALTRARIEGCAAGGFVETAYRVLGVACDGLYALGVVLFGWYAPHVRLARGLPALCTGRRRPNALDRG